MNTAEADDIRLRRLIMRSNRRGIKEMDIILGRFAECGLANLCAHEITLYDRMLSENDHDLYAWVTAKVASPKIYENLIEKIARTTVR